MMAPDADRPPNPPPTDEDRAPKLAEVLDEYGENGEHFISSDLRSFLFEASGVLRRLGYRANPGTPADGGGIAAKARRGLIALLLRVAELEPLGDSRDLDRVRRLVAFARHELGGAEPPAPVAESAPSVATMARRSAEEVAAPPNAAPRNRGRDFAAAAFSVASAELVKAANGESLDAIRLHLGTAADALREAVEGFTETPW